MSQLEKIVLLKLNDKRDVYNKNIPAGIADEVRKKIGSQFRPGTRDTIRGLNPDQERIYLPNILGLNANDAQFTFRAKDFWTDYSLTPTVEGLRLNIATTKSKISVKRVMEEKEVEVEEEVETPVDWDGYIAYKFAMASSQVAKTEHELANLGLYDFYLIDLSKEEAKKESEFEVKDKADNLYVRLVAKFDDNIAKIDWIIELMRDKKVYIDIDSLAPLQKKMMLSDFKNNRPADFIATANKESLETEAFVSKCVTNGIILKEGNHYFYGDEDLGTDIAIVAWFKNPLSSGKHMAMKAKLEDIIKNKRQ